MPGGKGLTVCYCPGQAQIPRSERVGQSPETVSGTPFRCAIECKKQGKRSSRGKNLSRGSSHGLKTGSHRHARTRCSASVTPASCHPSYITCVPCTEAQQCRTPQSTCLTRSHLTTPPLRPSPNPGPHAPHASPASPSPGAAAAAPGPFPPPPPRVGLGFGRASGNAARANFLSPTCTNRDALAELLMAFAKLL